MGYASYLEDLIGRLDSFEETINSHNKSSDKNIDIGAYFELRQEILRVIGKIKPYTDGDIIENVQLRKQNENLRKQNQNIQIQLQNLTSQNEKLVKDLQAASRKRTEQHIQQEAALLQRAKQIQNDYSVLLLDVSSLFHEMKKVTKADGWSKIKNNLIRIEKLIDNGLKKTL